MTSNLPVIRPLVGGGLAFAACAMLGAADPSSPPLPKGGLTPQQAIAKMTVPEGFVVKAFASEPDVVQPFSFCFDDRGRLWVAENLNYSTRGSHDNGPKSRIVVYEDLDGDGRFDKKKIFLDGVFFPSGIEKGFGGIFFGSPPNLLFVPDRNGDDVPDGPAEVLLDGWGIEDRHETLNSFVWGPDGWLYGCHGVFTQAKVGRPGASDADRVRFNAGWWRYHPLDRKFELFAEGASNQWAVAFDDHGQAFATACVIPHLWHVIQGGRYHRQAGPHVLPYTYDDIKTITDHKHKSAHGGARIYLADNFPERYRHRLVMGHIHDHALLTDILERKGSGYVGHHGDEFLVSNDNLFLGFQIEIGPEGGVYVLDWYDTDICGRKVDAEQTGRIWRVTYGDVKTPTGLRLSALPDDELIQLLVHVNDWYGRHARRILQERAARRALKPGTRPALVKMLADAPTVPHKLRALWALHVTGGADPALLTRLLDHESEHLRAWAVQLLCEKQTPDAAALAKFAERAANDESPLVRRYLASALQRIDLDARWPIAEALLKHAEDAEDHNLPLMYWYGMEPLAGVDKLRALRMATLGKIPTVRQFMARRVAEGTAAAADPGKTGPATKVSQEALRTALAEFEVLASGEGGVALVADHFGRPAVRTHPVDRQTPSVLRRQVEVPVNKITKLVVPVAHDAKGDWQLVAKVDGTVAKEVLVSKGTAKDGWLEVEIDLTPHKGRTVRVDLENRANDWSWEFAYWGRLRVTTD